MTITDTWQPDSLLTGFESLELRFPDDYDGSVTATLVRLPTAGAPRGTVLYVHGFIDYFFQRHLAERFNNEGYAFYALDLRKHGRSLRPHQHPNFCKSIKEYYRDLTVALEKIGAPVILLGHSTGGLICSLYAHDGECRDRIKALCLNSPFFDFNVPPQKRALLAVGAALGRWFPFANDPHAITPAYPKSIHKDYSGEWDFDLRLKPIEGFPAYFGWVRAIRIAQAQVHAGLTIGCPILSMHSDDSDIVLNWRDIERWSHTLGRNVTIQAFPGGFHDLVLSRRDIREAVMHGVLVWLEENR